MVIAIAALSVGIINVTQHPTPSVTVTERPSPSPSPSTTSAAAQTAANRALCEAIAPLMAESDRSGKALSSQAPSTSPGWNAAMPKFISDTKDWVTRIQPIVDTHPDVDPYFHRTLQRFIDDQRNLVADLEAGPWQPYDQTIWNDGLGAWNGPQVICWDLGIKW